MLNFIYYPVSAIMWFWHEVFGFVLGESNGFAWALSIVFLVFTLRAVLFKPFVGQIRSMRKMQEMQPEMQKLRKKYANDKQKLASEMQKLQQSNGANPLGGCLPILVQVPVFIGLFHVLREFKPGKLENYVFNAQEVQSFVDSDLLGAKLGAAVFPLSSFGGQGIASVQELGGNLVYQWIVMIPLMIAAGVFTHITARHSVARQQAQQGAMDNTQAAIMQKLMLYVFPIGVVVGAPFLPWRSSSTGSRTTCGRSASSTSSTRRSTPRRPRSGTRPPRRPARSLRSPARSRSVRRTASRATTALNRQKPRVKTSPRTVTEPTLPPRRPRPTGTGPARTDRDRVRPETDPADSRRRSPARSP